MAVIEEINIFVNSCTSGAFVRWYYNGWHYELFSNRYTTEQVSKSNGVQVVEKFSAISKVEKNTSRKNDVFISFGIDNVSKESIEVYKGLLIAETVQLYQYTQWVNLEINRSSFTIRPTRLNRFNIDCTAWVKELLSASQLIVPPTEPPAESFDWTDNFDTWTGSPPYSQVPLNWVSFATPTSSDYVTENSGNAEFHASTFSYYTGSKIKFDIEAYLSRFMTGQVKVEFNILSISTGCQISVGFFDSSGNPCATSYNTTSAGAKTNTFTLTANAKWLYIGLFPISGGGKTAVVEYIKMTQL